MAILVATYLGSIGVLFLLLLRAVKVLIGFVSLHFILVTNLIFGGFSVPDGPLVVIELFKSGSKKTSLGG